MKNKLIVDLFGLIVFLVSFMLLIGYLYKAPLLYGSKIIPVALPSAICFFLLSISFIRINGLPFGFSNYNTIQLQLAKSFLPLVIVIIILQGFMNTNILLHAQNPALNSAFVLFIAIVISIVFILKNSDSIGKKLAKAEQQLKESEERFRGAFETSAIGMALVSLDGNFLQVNSNLCKILGYSGEDLLLKTFQDITHHDDLQIDLALLNKTVKGEIPSYQIEKRYFHKNQALVWVNLSVSLVRSNTNEPLYFVSQIEDITKRKKLEEKVKLQTKEIIKNEELLSLTAQTAKVGGWEIDLKSNTLSWTSETYRIHELSENSSITVEKAIDFYYGDSKNNINKAVDESIKLGKPFDEELKIVTAKGNIIDVRALGNVKKDFNGNLVSIYGAFQDITERKIAEQNLIETNQSLEEMVFIASHDLQVPLVSMEGYATELLERYADKFDDEGKYCLTRLQSNARRMHALVLSLLDISRLNTKKNPYEKFSLNSIIGKIIQDISLTIEKQQATIKVGKLPELFADRIRIESVFRNLIVNSLNYGAKIVSLGYNNNTLFVTDNGIGIPANQLERIFNPGERLKKIDADGVGMGLTFCKKVIERHKGKIWAESDGENKGTTIYIKLT